MKNRSTDKCPFEVVYTKQPRLTFDLASLPTVVDTSSEVEKMREKIQNLHDDSIQQRGNRQKEKTSYLY